MVYDDTAPDPIVATARVADSDGAVGIGDHTMRFGCDGVDLPDYPDADLIGCGLNRRCRAPPPVSQASVSPSRSSGEISPEYQYRIGFDTNGNGGVDKTVKYDNGGISGGSVSAEAELTDGVLNVTVLLADVVTTCPDDPLSQCVIWQIETQGGVAGGPGLGFLDRARDELTVSKIS